MRVLARLAGTIREGLRGLLFRGEEDAATREEMVFHLEMEAERLVREEGLEPGEARRRAAVAFGGVERHREAAREARPFGWVGGLSLDLKLGARMLRKHPGLTVIGGLGMAVGIAVSVGFFAFTLAHIYPEIPLDEGDRIVALENRDVRINNEERQSLHDFFTWREELRSVEDLAAFRTVERNLLTGEGPPELVFVAEITAAGFEVARVAPLMGRYLTPEDEREGAPAVIVIGYDVWQDRFAADPGIVGRDIRFGNNVQTVVGVMPEGFAFPENHAFWTPLRADPSDWARREGPAVFIFGRLAPGVSMEEAQAELTVVGRRAAEAFPESNGDLRPMVMPYTHSLTDVQGITLWEVGLMNGMMSLLLLVVALNVAVLIYARTATRRGEIAVRSAIGASRRRIIGQLFLEALVLSLGAAALGLALAHVGVSLGNAIMATEMEVGTPFWMDTGLRPGTVLWTVGLAVLAAVIVGVLPGLRVAGGRVQSDLRSLGGATGIRLGGLWTALVVVQLAIAVAALPAAVNMGLDFLGSAASRSTYPAEDYLVASLRMDGLGDVAAEAPWDRERSIDGEGDARDRGLARFGERVRELVRRLEAEPAVAGATFTSGITGQHGAVRVEGMAAPAESPAGHRIPSSGVWQGYFDLFEARVLAGRAFQPGDFADGATAVVVTQTFANQVLDGGRAVGRRIRWVDPESSTDEAESAPERWHEIVGVVEDMVVNRAAPEKVRPVVYYPVTPGQADWARVVVRVRNGGAAAFTPRLREVAAAVDPGLRLGRTYVMSDFDRQERLAFRLVALGVALTLLSVLLLSGAGVYAMMSFTVTQRRAEIGLRSALGAQPWQVVTGVMARAGLQIGLGVAAGLALAAGIELASDGGLMGGRGAIILPAFALVMTAVGLLAAWGPARRGLRVPPAEALRAE